jgi:hypothetical protein
MYLVLSAFTSSPIPLRATAKAFFMCLSTQNFYKYRIYCTVKLYTQKSIKGQKDGENYIIRIFIIFTVNIRLERLNQGG